MIEDVEDLGAKLQLDRLGELGGLEQRQIKVVIAGADQRIAPETAEVLGAALKS